MGEFNAKRARAKRPCPLWVDAFQRDTQHLQADEVGAYMLILMAMWTRETCDFPDDDSRLARVSRVSTRLWKSRVGPVIREFFGVENGALISKKLREEATYVERAVKAQSNRKTGEKSDKPLKNNKQSQSTDMPTDSTVDVSPDHPTQQPNNPTYKIDDVARAREPDPPPTHREQLLAAIGADPVSGLNGPNGVKLGGGADMAEVGKWSGLGLTEAEQLAEVRRVVDRRRPDAGPLKSFSYFSQPMADLAAAKAKPLPAGTVRMGQGAERKDQQLARWERIANR